MGRWIVPVISFIGVLLWNTSGFAATADCSIPSNDKQIWSDYTKTPSCRMCLGGREAPCGTQGVLSKTTPVTGMSGATAVATDAIDEKSIVFIVSTEIKTAVTGAGGLTGFMIGDEQHPGRWGTQTTMTVGATTSIANFAITSSAVPYATNTDIILTAIPSGATFSTGAVDVVVQRTIDTLGAPAQTESGEVFSDDADTVRGKLSEEIIGDGNLIVGVVNQGGNRKTQLSITGAAQDINIKTDPADTTAGTLSEELVAGNDLICEVIGSIGANRQLRCRIGSWTRTIPFMAGAWSALNCDTPSDVELSPTRRKGFFVRNCTGTTSELHFTYKMPTNLDCSIPVRLRVFAQWIGTASPAGATVTLRTQAWWHGTGEVEPEIRLTTLNGAGGAADTQTMQFNQQFVPGNILTGNLVTHGTCAGGKFLSYRVAITDSNPVSGTIPNIAFMDGEPIYGLTRLSHQ